MWYLKTRRRTRRKSCPPVPRPPGPAPVEAALVTLAMHGSALETWDGEAVACLHALQQIDHPRSAVRQAEVEALIRQIRHVASQIGELQRKGETAQMNFIRNRGLHDLKLKQVERELQQASGVLTSICRQEQRRGLLQRLFATIRPDASPVVAGQAAQVKALEGRLQTLLRETPLSPVVRIDEATRQCDAIGKQCRQLPAMLRGITEEAAAACREARRQAETQRKAALAAAHLGKARDQARQVTPRLKASTYCPYCQKPIGKKPHADHIYPVSRGGLSTTENMVYICAECNVRKSDMTLRQFIEDFGLDRGEIEKALKGLKKAF